VNGPPVDSARHLRGRSRTTANFVNRHGIEVCLERAVTRHLAGRAGLRLLDLGCGGRPYESLLAGPEVRCFGADLVANPAADLRTAGESLAFRDCSFDTVLCLQTLEHVGDPRRVLDEVARVLVPGGLLLLSTHGSMVFHPTPEDHWRWTQTGLRRLLAENGRFDVVSLEPVAGTFASLAFLNAWYADVLLRKIEQRAGFVALPITLARRLLLGTLNTTGLLMDRALPDFGRIDRPNTLFVSFFAVCRRPGADGTYRRDDA
jgi:SAM-dependent methyltransferase